MEDQNKGTLPDTLGEVVVNFGDVCRFCLTETKDGISVHEKCLSGESDELESESVYKFITKLRIIEDENIQNFPSQICKSCYELVKLFHNFSRVCQKSDSLLRECYQSTIRETKMRLNLRDIDKSGFEIPELSESNYLCVNVPQVVKFVVDDMKQSGQKENDSIVSYEKYKQKLNYSSEEIKKKLTFYKSSKLMKSTNAVPGIRNEKTLYACSQCSLQFSSPTALNLHYIATHGGNKCRTVFKFQCRNCRKSFTRLDRLKRHYRIIHRISESELTEAFLNQKVSHLIQASKINFCFQCVPYKQFQTQKELLEHLESHKTKQTKASSTLYSCAHCTRAIFNTKHDLNQHLSRVHKLKEDEITWNDVKCVSVAQKSPAGGPLPKLLICMNPTPLSCEPQQKPKNNSLADSAADPLISQREHLLGIEPPCNPVEEFAPPNGFADDNCTEDSAEGKEDAGWNCPECPASYSRKQSLHCHMREKHNHANPGATKCPECSETFLTNRRLIRHGISVHQKYFAYFHHVFKKVLQPGREEGEDNREKNFECDVCRRKYIYKTSLRKHILAAHLGKSAKDAVTCSYCGKTFSNGLNLKSHIEFVHEALFVSCPICKKKINFRTIGRHYKTHRSNQDGVFPGNNFLCNLCGKVLKFKRSFEDHQKLHQNIRDEICDVCGSGFTTKKLLRFHKKTHEGAARKLFPCDQCEKVFSGRHTLNRHLLTHSGKKNFICEICSKCFYTIQELNRHVRYHKKDYRFDCQLCDMRFLCKSRFRHHMMKHRNIRPHKCQFCDKMFIERAKMNVHMAAKHNVEVPNTKTVWKDPKTYIPLDDLL